MEEKRKMREKKASSFAKKRAKGEARREEKKLRKLKREAEISEEEGTKTYSVVIGRSLKNKKDRRSGD